MYTRTHFLGFAAVQTLFMTKKASPRPKRPSYRPTFIRQWREYRRLTLEQLADRVDMTHASLSRIERGLQPYSQPVLEAVADALGTDVPSLLMRNPSEADAIWSIWEKASQGQREQIVEISATITRSKSQ